MKGSSFKKGYKVFIISICVFLISISVFVLGATVYVSWFSDKNINEQYDEELFALSKKDTVTEYYGNVALPGEEYVFEKIDSIVLGEKTKLWVPLNDVGKYLKNGFVAVEDRRFYTHSGVDLKRTLYALANTIFHFKPTFGASTITQQVIKNMSGDNEITLKRKMSEIIRAYNVERKHTKDEILEVYLNIIPMGENLYGVRAAAYQYFKKQPFELDASEAATLIGITNAPSKYNPHKNPDECLEKRNEVLLTMFSRGVISENEYAEAKSRALGVYESSEDFEVMSWFIETVNKDIVSYMVNNMGMSKSAAQTILYNGGLKIYTTQNPMIQEKLEEFFADEQNLSSEVKKGLDYSMVVCDSLNGNLLGIIGASGKKSADMLLNLAMEPHTPGSTLKPIALYAPLLNEEKINWATVFDDVPYEFIEDNGRFIEYPNNSPRIYDGLTTVKDALRLSKNTVAMRLHSMLGSEKIYDNLEKNFGFDTLVNGEIANNGRKLTDIAPAPLALGQLTYGIPLRSLTEAYTVFPSEGKLTKGRSFLYVYDSEENLMIENFTEQKQVFSSECSKIMNMLLSSVTESGTASSIKLKNKINTAGKTGTSGDDKDRLFIGYTPYITAGIWCGYRNSDKSLAGAKPKHIKIWDEIMNDIHNELLMAIPKNEVREFSQKGLIKCDYCRDSGELFSPICSKDPRGCRLESGYFTANNKPYKLCSRHVLCKYDVLTESVATEFCPEDSIVEIALLKIPDRRFPKQIIVTDAEYVYFDVECDNYAGDFDVPYFQKYIPEGEYVGRAGKKKQYNSGCYIHSE